MPPGRKERPVSQHSYQTISNRSSRNLEDAKFDEYNNVRLVADGAKLHIVQEGKVWERKSFLSFFKLLWRTK